VSKMKVEKKGSGGGKKGKAGPCKICGGKKRKRKEGRGRKNKKGQNSTATDPLLGQD